MNKNRIPSLNWLRVFEAAGRTESFAKAATILNMSAPAVSQQIRALETHFGKALFIRETRRVRLTESGRAFLPIVQNSLSSIEATATTIFGSEQVEQVMIQAVALLAMGWLPKIVAGFEAANPNVKVNILTLENTSEVGNNTSDSIPDIQIVFGSDSEFPKSAKRLFGEEVFPVARHDIAERITSANSLRYFTLLEVSSHQCGWFQILTDNCELNPEDVQIKMVDSTPIAFMMAREGLGIALCRSPASDGLQQSLNLVPCNRLIPIVGRQQYYLLSSETLGMRSGAAKLRDWILNAAKNEVT